MNGKFCGELQFFKDSENEAFTAFLDGETLEECYDSVAAVANRWLDVLLSRVKDLKDEELFDLISENRTLPKTLEDCSNEKSTTATAAKRITEYRANQMVKDNGLACDLIIFGHPPDVPIWESALSFTIFETDPRVKEDFLKKWHAFDIRDILDWRYYKNRFERVIQELITIPAAIQKVPNPVPHVKHPEWLLEQVAEESLDVGDIEDLNISGSVSIAISQLPKIARVYKRGHKSKDSNGSAQKEPKKQKSKGKRKPAKL